MNTKYLRLKEIIRNNSFFIIVLVTVRAYVLYFFNRIFHYHLQKKDFYKKLGYPLNLKKPQSLNEKIVWKKIYDRNPLLVIVADKYQVRSYLKKILGEEKAKEILIPLLYVTVKPETIPFEKLPNDFIIKANHASKRNIIVEDNHFDKKEIIKTCQRWLKTPYGLEKMEWAYQLINRKIVIEELLREEDGSIPKDYKFYIFHGKCKLACVDVYEVNNNVRSRSYFDERWHFLPIKKSKIIQGPKVIKPKNFGIMLELAEKLSKPFDHVRVDLYNLNGKIYFGELTNYEGSGTSKYEHQSVDFELGRYWKIEPGYWEE